MAESMKVNDGGAQAHLGAERNEDGKPTAAEQSNSTRKVTL